MEDAHIRCHRAYVESGLTLDEISKKSNIPIATLKRMMKSPDKRPRLYKAFGDAVNVCPCYLTYGVTVNEKETAISCDNIEQKIKELSGLVNQYIQCNLSNKK